MNLVVLSFTASANTETSSGETVMPDSEDMTWEFVIKQSDRSAVSSSLLCGAVIVDMSSPSNSAYVPYQAYKVGKFYCHVL